ncbi:hypothetical protein A3H85_02420 [Candidatus Daviesbacteria bacterium RIFCSPLOWO2_02_FULL_40_8]|uniref:HNH nuclease domain-containing protein n=1 Tax=Candidatus Daviesbacteria bacterium RIFCSPLOWO2_01_FULL_40_24 TaxID=1797787 RepID=A0A1F5MKI1_9BACT|nr:MAG: hypothetical protein A3B49_03790 [Candidatus Daviesbacteria bacterium RIFCSPLOWO2_01_FULL_40_24]OGE66730.1 MAG: hypothetical protein A3H85_02420 [Candidatus Daviesbacteria bacterium RIFCSPLOWO2_02_FULL_40_8]
MAKETRTYEDRKAYLAKMTNVRRRRLKNLMINYKGGKCQVCGYDRCLGALSFHHIDPEQKSFKLSMDELYRSWKVIIKELDKCHLLCANCHQEVHASLINLQTN